MTLVSLTTPAVPDTQTGGHVMSYRIADLLPHPALTRLSLGPSARELSDPTIRREQGHWDQVTVSRERTFLPGKRNGCLANRGTRHIDCLQLDLSESEALLWLIERHKRSSSLSDFSRILLALELESLFRERAASNRSRGGREKGSSNLTEADHVDVRSEIAKAAGVSVGNVSKAKKLISASCPELLEALREGEVSIHRASQWIDCEQRPEDLLRLYRSRRGIGRDIRQLIARHESSSTPVGERFDLKRMAKAIADMTPDQRERVAVGELAHPGFALVVSSALLKALESQGELMQSKAPFKDLLALTRAKWQATTESPAVRDNFSKVLACRTPAVGAEVYASANENKIVFHTCKSRCCPSCGNRATLLWQREQWAMLPDIPFVGIVLTMPDVLWPVFRGASHLQHDLPALWGAVIKNGAWNKYRVRLCIMVIQHTFGGHLNYNPHLHMMVSGAGLDPAKTRWVRSLAFDKEEIMALWRSTVIEYLEQAYCCGSTLAATPDLSVCLGAKPRAGGILA